MIFDVCDNMICSCRMKRVTKDSLSMWMVQWQLPAATLVDSPEAIYNLENPQPKSPDLDINSLSVWARARVCDNPYAARANAADRAVLAEVDRSAVKEEDCFWYIRHRKGPAKRHQLCHQSTLDLRASRRCSTVSFCF